LQSTAFKAAASSAGDQVLMACLLIKIAKEGGGGDRLSARRWPQAVGNFDFPLLRKYYFSLGKCGSIAL
jgi:hypothetical protein